MLLDDTCFCTLSKTLCIRPSANKFQDNQDGGRGCGFDHKRASIVAVVALVRMKIRNETRVSTVVAVWLILRWKRIRRFLFECRNCLLSWCDLPQTRKDNGHRLLKHSFWDPLALLPKCGLNTLVYHVIIPSITYLICKPGLYVSLE